MHLQIIAGILVAVTLVIGGGYYLYRTDAIHVVDDIFSFRFPTSTFSYGIVPPGSIPGSRSRPRSSPPPPPTNPRPSSPVSPPPLISTSSIPQGFTRSQLSPYFNQISIGSARGGSGGNSYGQISISARLPGTERVNITGWQFKSNRGGYFIPEAVEVYSPTGALTKGGLFLTNGDRVHFYSRSGINPPNMRLNKCIGYLGNHANFVPTLPRSCPSHNSSELRALSGQCQDYILSLNSCREPASNPPISIYDYACRAYLDTVNYKGCFEKYRGDSDFLSHEWRVWNGGEILDVRHDQLLLLDTKGLLVDEYSY